MPSNKDDFQAVRLQKGTIERAAEIAREVGVPSATWFLQRAADEMLDLIEAKRRIVPKLVKIVDGVRAPDVELEDPTPGRAVEPAPKRGALRVGQG